jgi:hypothetical protein
MRWLLLTLAASCLLAQPPTELGPKVGSVIPAFRLPDQHGQQRDLASVSGPKGAVLVFHRSADW